MTISVMAMRAIMSAYSTKPCPLLSIVVSCAIFLYMSDFITNSFPPLCNGCATCKLAKIRLSSYHCFTSTLHPVFLHSSNILHTKPFSTAFRPSHVDLPPQQKSILTVCAQQRLPLFLCRHEICQRAVRADQHVFESVAVEKLTRPADVHDVQI